MKTLVAYFSESGHTEKAARGIAQVSDSVLYQIQPEKPYTEADLEDNPKSRAYIEQHDPKSRPAIVKDLGDTSQYEAVYLGFPIWYDRAPAVIYSFLDAYDFKGKRMFIFATSAEDSLKDAASDLAATYPDLDWVEGQLIEE